MAVTLLAGAALAGCKNGAQAEAVQPAPGHTAEISTAQAMAAVVQYDKANNAVNARYDAAGLATIEALPGEATSKARLLQAKVLRQAVPPVTHPPEQIVIPRIDSFPRWFVVTAPVVKSGAATPRLKYLILVQEKAQGPWRVAYYPYPSGDEEVPPMAVDSQGTATLVTDAGGLATDPAQLNKAIFNYYVSNKDSSVQLAPTTALEKQLSDGYQLGQQQEQARGVDFVRTFQQTPYPSYLVRTADGGVLAFTANEVRDTLTASAHNGVVTFDPGTPEAATLGRPEGAKAHTYTVERLQMFMSYIPAAGSAQPVQVLAYDDAVIAVH